MKETNWLASESGKICEYTFLALAVIVPFGTTLARRPHPSSLVMLVTVSTWLCVFFLSLGIIFVFVAGELTKRCQSLTNLLEQNYPWPKDRWHELQELVRRLCNSERQAEFYESTGIDFCTGGMLIALIGLMASPFAILLHH